MRDETLDDFLERNNLFLCSELTDEEIIDCMGSLPKYNSEIVDEDLVKFAKAILKKAQEK